MRQARLALALLLTVSLGCAQKDWIDRTLVTENVTGGWTGSFGEGNSYRLIQLELRQQGAKVTGVLIVPIVTFGSNVPIVGSVTGDVFTFRDQRGIYSGELTVGGDNMDGQILGPFGNRRASLRRGSAGAQSDSAPR